MSDCASRRLSGFLLLAVLLGWAAAFAERSREAHPVGEECNSCHLRRGEITGEAARMLVASQEKLCSRCHPGALKVSHPSGFAPRIPVPADFPLDWKGDLTCSSCHEVHGNEPGTLRVARRGRGFCMSCHAESFFEQMADGGNSVVVSGHLAAADGDGGNGPDAFSMQCMACHADLDGELGVVLGGSGLMRHAQDRVNHPIGVSYESAARFGGYRNMNAIPEEILLPEGKVSCVSCHRGYSVQHGKMVVSQRGSSLCYGCHDL